MTPAIAGEHRDGDATRALILKTVREQPGVHKSQLCRSVGLGWGTVSYHLRLLEKARQLQVLSGPRETRVFPPTVPTDQLRGLAALRSEPGAQIAKALAANPGARQREICRAVGASRKLIRRHLEVMRNEGLVSIQGERRARYTPTPALEFLLKQQAATPEIPPVDPSLDPHPPA